MIKAPSIPGTKTSVACAALVVASVFLGASASAHIELQSPLNRYSDIKKGDNKSCPCGSGTTNRSCKEPTERSDPDRSTDRATTFAPGDTISVRFDEYVGHSGRYRIAFDPDGADLTDFNDNILLDEVDPPGNTGNMGDGSIWQFDVKLPDVTCDNCTLQLIQVMDGNTTDPVADPVLRGGTYFQCADIVLADGSPSGGIPPLAPTEHLGQEMGRLPAPGGGADPAGTNAGSGVTDMVSPGATAPAATGMLVGAPSGTNATGSSSAMSAAAATPVVMDADTESDGGCALTHLGQRNGAPAFGMFALISLAAWRIRRRGC